jgi:hypothetical protein
MQDAGKALTTVASDDLKKLLTAIYRGHLEGALEVTGLTRVGLQHCALELTGHMRELDLKGVQAVLVAVLAEAGQG